MISKYFGNEPAGPSRKIVLPRNPRLSGNKYFHFSAPELLNTDKPEDSSAQLILACDAPTPTEADQLQFKNASVNGVNAAQQAIQIDAQEPANWSVLGGIYGVLAFVNVEGAKDRALEAFAKSRELSPKNPLSYLESAIVEARSQNYEGARGYIEQAIALKPNFTEAFYILSQLEIAKGNVEGAIKSTQAVISL